MADGSIATVFVSSGVKATLGYDDKSLESVIEYNIVQWMICCQCFSAAVSAPTRRIWEGYFFCAEVEQVKLVYSAQQQLSNLEAFFSFGGLCFVINEQIYRSTISYPFVYSEK